MSTRTKQHQPSSDDLDNSIPFKESIGHIQSILLVILTLGLLEVGFLYSTVLMYVLMTIAFYEMISVQTR
jgi:type IV secretory pathway TrbL component